jgi:hypothetical protein
MKTLRCAHCQGSKKRFGSSYALAAHMMAKHPGIEITPVAKPGKPTGKRKRDPFYQSIEWIRIRYEALKRGRGVCECCGVGPQQGAVLNVDHIKPRRLFPELSLDLENLQVLCAQFNMGKGNDDQTDWRDLRGRSIDEILDIWGMNNLARFH